MNSHQRVVMLIDADNVSADVIEQAMDKVMAEHGAIHVRRAYCTAESALANLKLFKAHSIRPIVNLSTGKNSTDIALAVDAVDLVISERPELVVIVSSDSDFAPLVIKLREKGCRVEGIGQQGKTGVDSKPVYDGFTDIAHRKAGGAERGAAFDTARGAAASPARKRAGTGTRRGRDAVHSQLPVFVPSELALMAAPVPMPTPAPMPAPVPQMTLPLTAETGAISGNEPAPRARAARGRARSVAQQQPPAPPPPPMPAPAVPSSSPHAAMPDDLRRILAVLPELARGGTLELGIAAERLRSEDLLAKNAPSTKLFRKYPEWFVLTPERQPNKVQYRGQERGQPRG